MVVSQWSMTRAAHNIEAADLCQVCILNSPYGFKKQAGFYRTLRRLYLRTQVLFEYLRSFRHNGVCFFNFKYSVRSVHKAKRVL